MRSDERVEFKQPVSFIVGETKGNGLGVDISFGGIGLTADYEFKKGEILELHLPLGNSNKAVPVRAEVLWVNNSNGKTRAGLRFLS